METFSGIILYYEGDKTLRYKDSSGEYLVLFWGREYKPEIYRLGEMQ